MKKSILVIVQIIFLTFICGVITSCGNNGNLFSDLPQRDTKQKAEDAINSGDYNTSINLLEPYVSANSSDQQAIGLLSTSYLLAAGINILNMAVSIISSNGNYKNNLQTVLAIMPAASQSNISLVTKAVNTISLVPAGQRNSNQNYMLAIANASLAMLTIKANCLNAAGTISTSLTSAMSTTDAANIYSYLSSAQSTFSSAGISSGSSSGSGILANFINQINSTTGGSNSAKVINFINSQA
ncbi:hypothetical protein QEJ31_10360 [Pigmentibacter sp. JX0631]|uniref:hypothetical protein n=1 Tax=Pigmentibacter sp. JX0631 TaxID=2976982 RepID=UPI002468D7EA|nr:hypothetical protein [Pigmentibacter sp. JX0631]WGL58924.1 hypothetical protein QEJ31_10360 [Pigmentibacter sp. JX0631]